MAQQENSFLGWGVAPCDLVFEGVSKLRVDIDMGINIPLTINDIRRCNPRLSPSNTVTIWEYEIELDLGRITFQSYGYTQTLRRQPVFSTFQSLTDRD